MRVAIIVTSVMLASSIAQAQVYKCPGPGGRVAYSDKPCADGKQLDDAQLQGNTLPAGPALAPAPPRAPSKQATVIGGEGRCPSERTIRNMETSASSMMLGTEEKLLRQAQIAAAKDCRSGGSGRVDMSAVETHRARMRAAAAVPPPATITSCDNAGCWDSQGQRYTKGAGPTFFRNDGKTCHQTGDVIRCN